MKRHISLWRLGLGVWPVLFVLLTGLESYRSTHQRGHPGRVDWLFVAVVTSGLVGLLVMIVAHRQSRPSPEQRAALSAIFRAGPGTIGAIVVTRNGVPEVIATVKSKEEYLHLAGSGQLPHDHHVYLPSDV